MRPIERSSRHDPWQPRHRGAAVALPCLLAVALTLAACRGTPDTPEAQIRALIARAVAAGEDKDAGTLRDMISSRYAGETAPDKRALTALLAYHFMRHRSIHLFSQVSDIALPEPGQATAVVYVAMAARPIPSLAALGALRADIVRFELTLAEEQPRDWKLTAAEWRPAALEDLH